MSTKLPAPTLYSTVPVPDGSSEKALEFHLIQLLDTTCFDNVPAIDYGFCGSSAPRDFFVQHRRRFDTYIISFVYHLSYVITYAEWLQSRAISVRSNEESISSSQHVNALILE